VQRFTGDKRIYIPALHLPFFFVASTSFPWIAAMPHAARQALAAPTALKLQVSQATTTPLKVKTRSQPHNKERKSRERQQQHTQVFGDFPFG